MSRPAVVIRVDSGAQMGSGHLMRCLSLAGELKSRGAQVRFVCRTLAGNLIARVELAGYRLDRLPAPAAIEAANDAVSTQHQDAAQTLAALGTDRVSWIVVDHYGLDALWQRSVRPATERLLVIDDLANRPHEADLLLDQNYLGANTTQRYSGLVAASCRCLLGPRYALLQPGYRQLRRRLRVRAGSVGRILVFFGAHDPSDSMLAVLQALTRPEFAALTVDVVLGSDARQAARARALARHASNILFHEDLPSLAELMAAADLAIGAGGATTWERACLGLPSVVATVAENQVPIAEALAGAGCIVLAGPAGAMSAERWHGLLRQLLNDELRLSEMSQKSYRLTDGFGAGRVARLIIGARNAQIRLRPVGAEDEWLLLEWANDPGTRHFSFSKHPITAAEHQRWLRERLADPGCSLLIGEDAAGLPLGQLRFDSTPGGEESTIHVGIDPAFRGCGVGTTLVQQAVTAWCAHGSGSRLLAEVSSDNRASQRLFLRANFTPTAPRRPNSVAFEFPRGSMSAPHLKEHGA
jgi:UDP-2,4-diacetamido-2,4,6-trideoxy-beta-L-altropyranose hydrolase